LYNVALLSDYLFRPLFS